MWHGLSLDTKGKDEEQQRGVAPTGIATKHCKSIADTFLRARAVAPRTHRVCACTCMHMRMHIYRTINNSLHLARDLVSHPRAPDADGLALGVEERHLEPPGLPADLDAARQCEQ